MQAQTKQFVAVLAGLMLALLWAYWPTLMSMVARWARDPQYSHGYLVPLFAAAFLWMRRERFPSGQLRPVVWGVILLAGAAAMRLVATVYYLEWFDALSFIPSIAGVVLLCGGWPLLRWSWPSILFLTFMVPLPHRIETEMREPMRRMGTVGTILPMRSAMPAAA